MFLLVSLLLSPLAGWSVDEAVITTVSTGEKMSPQSHLVAGRFVIFDFYADWCGPCRKWAPTIERIAEKYPDNVVVRKVDIQNWGTPVAIQHNIKRLPYLWLYGPNGKRVREGHPRQVLDYLERKAKKGGW